MLRQAGTSRVVSCSQLDTLVTACSREGGCVQLRRREVSPIYPPASPDAVVLSGLGGRQSGAMRNLRPGGGVVPEALLLHTRGVAAAAYRTS
ncbi:hypothetical protein ElyMa_001709100 [Elysia marginata]|uniref:Uncharacterized protein n=1 Tax=Elysia marginata TaxID=1093978 RepID=A0AAV4JUT7_9GAST|nr:hypothetical protein ElyMa_001709100 [Elysia marginata]